MKISPNLSDVRAIAATGQYNVLPVSCEIFSDFITPIETMKILKNVSTHCYMLESAQANETWGRYTFLGFDPKLEVTCSCGRLKAGNFKVNTHNPSDYLRQILADYKSPHFDYLPSFTGGLVGYFSYDYLGYSEPTVRCDAEDTEDFKDVDLMLFDKVIAFDHLRQKIILIVNMSLADVEVGYNKAVMELHQLARLLHNGEKKNEPGGKLLGNVTPLFDKKQFCGMVEKAKHSIREGDIFQIVLSNRLSAPFEGSLFNTYRVLRTINPSPYMFYFSGTDVEVAGASPETLVKLENGVLHTFPLAVREANPWAIMSSYNNVNNGKVCENPELITDVPRKEWNWDGVFVTDWWNDSNHVRELKAGHDLKMSGGDIEGVTNALDTGELTREQVYPSAERILKMLMKIKYVKDFLKNEKK